MKTVTYRDVDGAIRVEEYDEYFRNYQAGLVPPQKIDVNGVLIESSKLYDVMLKAATNAANKEEEEKEKRYAERFYKLTWGRLIVYIQGMITFSWLFYMYITGPANPVLTIASAFLLIIYVYFFFRDILAYKRYKNNHE